MQYEIDRQQRLHHNVAWEKTKLRSLCSILKSTINRIYCALKWKNLKKHESNRLPVFNANDQRALGCVASSQSLESPEFINHEQAKPNGKIPSTKQMGTILVDIGTHEDIVRIVPAITLTREKCH